MIRFPENIYRGGNRMYLTKSNTIIIGQVAMILGVIMNLIYNAQYAIGLDNIGLCIILFTIVVNMLMTPLTYQQQKFSKLQAKMNPELQAVQKKYKGKNGDQAAMAKMNEETQAIYAKYGVNPMGSCLQLLIQMPILFALYRVIWNIPAYVDKVKALFIPLADSLLKADGAEAYLTETAKSVAVKFSEFSVDNIIDVLNKFKPSNWEALAAKFPDLSEQINTTRVSVNKVNAFLGGLDVADSPMNIIRTAWSNKAILLIIAAVMIPVLAAVTQWLNSKLMMGMQDKKADDGKDAPKDQMSQTMKSMNTVMPLMSAVFCLSLPVGLGIYWIAGAVIRSIQQIVINKQLDKMDIDELAKKNMEKLNEKRAKKGLPPEKMNANAHISTRNIDTGSKHQVSASKRAELQKKASEISTDSNTDSSNIKPGSLAAKANLVKKYNDSHTKK